MVVLKPSTFLGEVFSPCAPVQPSCLFHCSRARHAVRCSVVENNVLCTITLNSCMATQHTMLRFLPSSCFPYHSYSTPLSISRPDAPDNAQARVQHAHPLKNNSSLPCKVAGRLYGSFLRKSHRTSHPCYHPPRRSPVSGRALSPVCSSMP